MSRSKLAAIIGFCGSIVACSSGSSSITPFTLDECPDERYDACDVLKASCQAQLLSLTACIYGVSAMPHVPIRVLSEDDLLKQLRADAEPADPAAEAAVPHLQRALVDLRLLQPDDLTEHGGVLGDIARRVNGLYEDAEHGITLVDRGLPQDGVDQDAQLIHELTHALQDQAYDLTTWRKAYPSFTDTSLALRSVTEGEATFVQYRAWAAMSGTDPNFVDWPATFVNLRLRLMTAALADDSPYFAMDATFPYGFGAVLANQAWSDEGPSYHASQFAEPPQTTLEVIAKALHKDVPELATPPFETPAATDDYSAVDDTVLGALLFEAVAHKLGDDAKDPLQLPLGWRGDRLFIYAGPDDETAWIWQLQLDSADTAQQLTDLAKKKDLSVEISDDRVFLYGGDHPPQFLIDAGQTFLDAAR